MWSKEEIGQIIKESRIAAGLTQKQVASNLSRPQQTIASWESGKSQPDANTLFELFRVLDRSVDEAFGFTPGLDVSFQEKNHIKKYRSLDKYGKEMVDNVLYLEHKRCIESAAKTIKAVRKSMPEVAEEIENVINLRFSELKASAGTGYQLDDDQTTTWKVLYNEYTRMADFCLEVDGQSMEPKIFDGDIILIRQQPSVEIGEIGLFTVNDTGYVKKQGEDRLISINRAFPDVFPNEYDTVFCRGKVIGVLDPEWIIER